MQSICTFAIFLLAALSVCAVTFAGEAEPTRVSTQFGAQRLDLVLGGG